MIRIEEVELTPNPQALKFIVDQNLLKFETRNFTSKEEAANDPLASGIFAINGVVSVFYMDKFITVEKEPKAGWGQIQQPLVAFLSSFDADNIPAEDESKVIESDGSDDILSKVIEIIEFKVKPALANDGGGLQIINMEDKTLTIHYEGACGSCPSATRNTLRAIEALLQRDVHPDIEVVAG